MVKLFFMLTDQQSNWLCLGLCLLMAVSSYWEIKQESEDEYPSEGAMFLGLLCLTIGAGLFVFMIACEIISLITDEQGLLF